MKKMEKVVLRDICDLLNRGISPKYSDEGNLILNQKCIRNNVVSFDDARYSSLEKKVSSEKYLKPFDILVNSTGTGTLGRTAQIKSLKQPTLVDTHVTIVRPNNKVDKIFIALQLALKEPEIISLGKGATNQQELGRTELGNIELLLPPLLIQRKISAILSAYDDLIVNNNKRIKLLEEMAQLTFNEWFGKEKESLPKNWEIKKLKEVADINKNQIKKGFEGNIRYVDISSVSPGKIDSYTEYEIENAPGRARRIVKHGDIIWSCVRPNRKSQCIIWDPENNLIVSTGFAVITPKEIPTSYLYQYLTTDAFVGYLTNRAGGAAYPAVKPDDFEEAEIIVPPKEKIESFDKIVKPSIELISNLTKQNRFLRESRDILLPRLLNGVIEVD